MKRPNITPGPWHTNPDKATSADVWTDHDNVRRFVACCPKGFKGQRQQTQDRWAEDAQAIAAVPELLAALWAIVYAHESPPGASMGEAKLCPMFADQAKQALTKAGYTF